MAQHRMDGQPVNLGDRVFDVAFGSGYVTYLAPDGGVTVVFDTNRSVGYSAGGVTRRFTHRTLFWYNPVVVPPPKGAPNWNALSAAIRALSDVLVTQGGVDERL